MYPNLRLVGMVGAGALVAALILSTSVGRRSTLAQESSPAPYAVEVIRDAPYASGPDADPRHQLDLYRPAGRAGYPVLLFVHGGAWVGGSKSDVAPVGRALAASGIGMAAINYRLSPLVTHPAHMQDIAAAFAWVVEHIAKYGGDPTRIVVGGHSAGGHLTSLLALDERYLAAVGHSPAEIQGVLSFSGVYWIEPWIVQWAVGAFPADAAGRLDASPVKHVQAGAPPFLLLISENDYGPLILETKVMRAALQRANVPVEVTTIADRDHYSMIWQMGGPDDAATQRMLTWLAGIWGEGF